MFYKIFIYVRYIRVWASLMAQMIKNPPAMKETWVQSLGWEDPLEEGTANPLLYSCLENPHGQRSLEGYNPWGHKESDMTEELNIYTCLLENEIKCRIP